MPIDYSTMKVGESFALPHPKLWEGENRDEYYRAQAYAAAHAHEFPRPQFEAAQNLGPNGKPVDGFTIRRVR